MPIPPRRPAPLVALLLALPCAAQERESAAVRLEAVAVDDATPRPLFPRIDLELQPYPADGLDGFPALGAEARWSKVTVAGRTIRLAFEQPEGAFALGRLHLPGGGEITGRARPAGEQTFAVLFDEVPFGAVTGRVTLLYRGTELAEAVFEPGTVRRGAATLGGALREVLLVDGNADGKYDGPADRWIALRSERAREVKTLRRPETMLLGEPQIPFEADGRAFHVARVAADGSACELVLDLPRTAMGDVLDRRYREVEEEYRARFRQEEAEFVRRYALDPSRPRTGEPATWARETLAEARVRAKREGKPLLVHYFVETNPWCYRYDHYTFPDAEVDALLRRFVLLRIDAQKDPGKSYEKTGARGFPTLLPLTSDGEPVEFRLRTRDADGRVTDLETPEKAITGWQRPTELITNLQRILDVIY